MDSMYGPMSWLRLHAAGKQVIGLTSAARTQTDFRLERPISAAAVSLLLNQITGGSIAPATASPAQSVPSGMSPSPEPEDQLPEEMPAKPGEDLRVRRRRGLLLCLRLRSGDGERRHQRRKERTIDH